jgi:aldose 1-epimerase
MDHLIGNEINLAIDLDNGARIASIQWHDLEFVVQPRNMLGWGWYSMAPWAGRVKNGFMKTDHGDVELPVNYAPPHAIHGFGFDSSWEVTYNDERSKHRSRLILPKPYEGAVVEQTIELLDNAIRWSLEYEPNGVDMPAWLGFHPWFARELERGEEAEIEFNPGKMMERGEDYLPTGKFITPKSQPWDDTFVDVRGLPAIRWAGAARIEIESDCAYWVVYDEDATGVCVEPQTAPPDAATLGIKGEHYLEALFTFHEDYGD